MTLLQLGDIVLLDRAGVHFRKEAIVLIEQHGGRVTYLPLLRAERSVWAVASESVSPLFFLLGGLLGKEPIENKYGQDARYPSGIDILHLIRVKSRGQKGLGPFT